MFARAEQPLQNSVKKWISTSRQKSLWNDNYFAIL